MTRAPLSLIAVSLISVGCSAPDATAPSGDQSTGPSFLPGGVIHRASVGSHDFTPPGVDANFSLIALQHADGRITGQYHDQFANGDGFHARVTCLNVIGNEAWIGGIITKGEAGGVSLVGLPVLTQVQDNGSSSNDTPDQISFSFIGVSDQLCLAAPPLPLFPLQGGEVKVE